MPQLLDPFSVTGRHNPPNGRHLGVLPTKRFLPNCQASSVEQFNLGIFSLGKIKTSQATKSLGQFGMQRPEGPLPYDDGSRVKLLGLAMPCQIPVQIGQIVETGGATPG